MSNRALAFTTKSLLQILKSFPAVSRYFVGFSGGADSTALVHALSKIQEQLDAPVSAVHVNHGIHPHADQWQSGCENFCHQHNIDLVCIKIDLTHSSGKGLEAEARHLRYEAIAALFKPGDCLLTAHHADDQAETLLLNLMRGSGVDGLSAMPDSRPLGAGILQRPLLKFKNSALLDYLGENNIEWTEDPSNLYLNHDRNFIRHQVIPSLEQRWPQVSQRLLLTREAMTDARYLLEKLADEYLKPNLSHPLVLRITPECLGSPELFKLVTRRWMKQSGATGFPVYQLDSFCDQVRQADKDNKILARWDNWILRCYKNQLWLNIGLEITPCPAVKWPKGQKALDLGNDVGELLLTDVAPVDGLTKEGSNIFPDGKFSVGGRINMNENVIGQGDIHKSLKNLFQSADIPPWLRDSIPLCKLDGELVALGDWCLNEKFAASLAENGISLNWRPKHPLLQFILKQQHRLKH